MEPELAIHAGFIARKAWDYQLEPELTATR